MSTYCPVFRELPVDEKGATGDKEDGLLMVLLVSRCKPVTVKFR